MWLDIVIAVIFVLSTAHGYRKGFVRTFIHTAGWLLAIILGFAWYPRVEAFLIENTNLYNIVNEKIQGRVTEQGTSIVDPVSDNIPTILKGVIDTAEDAVTSVLTDGLSGFLFHMISFLAIVIFIRLIFLLISSLLSKKHHDGLIGFIDGFLGLLAGALKGIILIFILLALMVPAISLYSGDFLVNGLAESRVAYTLYDNNLILLIIKSSF